MATGEHGRVTNVAPEVSSSPYDVAMRRIVLALAIAACGDNHVIGTPVISDGDALACTPVSGSRIVLRQIAKIHGALLLVTGPTNDPRQFVLEQPGRIWIIENGEVKHDPFLDITLDAGGPVSCCGELGLLGLAFHPDYANNGIFYVFYTTTPGADVLAR